MFVARVILSYVRGVFVNSDWVALKAVLNFSVSINREWNVCAYQILAA